MRGQNALWLEFKGKKSSEFGVIVTALPDYVRAVERGEWVHVPGGAPVWLGEGCYDNVKITVEFLVPLPKCEAVAGWLSGQGNLRNSTQSERYRPARAGALSFERPSAGSDLCRAKATFEAHPYAYVHGEQPVTLTAPGLIESAGTVDSLPLINLYGTGDISLLIGGKTLMLHGIEGNISIDAAAKIAHSGGMLATSKMYGDWPVIPPGGCAVSWTGSVTSVQIQRNQRFL